MEANLFDSTDGTEDQILYLEAKTLFTNLATSRPILKKGTLYSTPDWESSYSFNISVIDNGMIQIQPQSEQILASKSLRWKKLEKLRDSAFGFTISGSKGIDEFYTKNAFDFIEWWDVLAPQMFVTNIEEQYRQCELLTVGDNYEIRKVQCYQSGAYFAVKTIFKERYYQKPKTIKFLVTEISILSALDCDQIVKIHRKFDHESCIHLVTPLWSGTTMKKMVKTENGISESNAATIIRQVLLALQYLHQKDIVHRDIKLDHILLKSEESKTDVMLTGFGFAVKIATDDCMKQCGTPGFVAPEVLLEGRYGRKVDIFSAGIVLYALISGKLPFTGKTAVERIDRNIECVIEFPEEKWGSISQGAIDLIIAMTSRDPDQRPTAQDALFNPWIIDQCGEKVQPIQFYPSSASSLDNSPGGVGSPLSWAHQHVQTGAKSINNLQVEWSDSSSNLSQHSGESSNSSLMKNFHNKSRRQSNKVKLDFGSVARKFSEDSINLMKVKQGEDNAEEQGSPNSDITQKSS